ncbi:hypothetical protein [Actinoplanes sp. NPDC049316]|uniref:hypothetical protein n=1 Tax=Actinoplanes sp. NPDC049316 TaxID=3154727 RepID=UPI00344007D5
MKAVLDYVAWLVCHLVAALFFTIAGLAAGLVVTLWLLDLEGLLYEVGPICGVVITAAVALGVLLMPRELAEIRAAPPDPDDLLRPFDPHDPLERLWRAQSYLPPHEHYVRPAVPPAPHQNPEGHIS